MGSFDIIFQFLMLMASWLIVPVFLYHEQYTSGFSELELTLFFFGVGILQFLITAILVQIYYQTPITKLEYTIKSFMVGNIKGADLEKNIKKSPNANLNFILDFFKKTIGTLKNIKSEFLHGKEIKGEVSIAKEIQGKTLEKTLAEVPSLNVIMKSKPAGEIGGDSFDIIKQDDNYYLYVGDATGHGVGAGFIMIMVNALISGFAKMFISGADILTKTNEILKPRVKTNLLMSLLLVRWNEKEKRVFMTGAGHEYLMIYKQASNRTFRIKSGGVALGMIKDISKVTKEREIQFEPGDIIVLYSDGITEAINRPSKNGTEKLFGEDGLEKAIQEAPNMEGCPYKSAQSVFNNITIALSQFMGYKHVQLDDVTLGVIQYKTDDYNKKSDFESAISKDFITEWSWEK